MCNVRISQNKIETSPHICCSSREQESGLCLSWSDGLKGVGRYGIRGVASVLEPLLIILFNSPRMCLSTNLGTVACVRLSSERVLAQERLWRSAHAYEAWVVDFDKINDSLLFSGMCKTRCSSS